MNTDRRPPPGETSERNGDPFQVGGIRIRRFLISKLYLFDSIRFKSFIRNMITIGRTRTSDIRIRNSTVSEHHCRITRMVNGEAWLTEERAKNGVYIDDPARSEGNWIRVSRVHLTVGMRIRLGDVRLVVTDHRGVVPLYAARQSDFARKALVRYGTPNAAAGFTGIPLRVLRRISKAD